MKSPFPGMDPYLEARWSDVHAKLIAYIGEALQPLLPAALRARAEERVLLETAEDEAAGSYRGDVVVIRTGSGAEGGAAAAPGPVATVEPVLIEQYDGPVVDRSVRIVDTSNGNRVVTAIEVLSPWNKAPGRLNADYRRKLDDYARGEVSVVEIDLLRHPPRGRLAVAQQDLPADRRTPYLVCVRRARAPRRWEAYPVSLRERLPRVPVPLRERDGDVGLDMQPLVDRVYVAGGHDDIDYRVPPEPALAGEDAAWADELLRAAGRR